MGGITPERPVAAAPKVVKLVSSPNCAGISPVKYGFPPILNCWRETKEPNWDGIDPLRRLSWIQSTCSAVRVESCEGIMPVSLLEFKKRNSSEESLPSSGGIGLERELEERSRSLRCESKPREGGIVPEMLVEERLRS